ncbi:alpha/beta hydrolase-fold protein [Streptomyces sp. MP131-18]|uniref:alpha/beta hydrolase n=1 Tax=Streptomyces sp. MP131-18 TaxID=1857892 RepID=UPI00209A963C|nr:alpha/beta hydrolase-fold protein [Streptomyces sp. MP131-18]
MTERYEYSRRRFMTAAAAFGGAAAAVGLAGGARAAGRGGARVARERRTGDRLVELTIDSPALGGQETVVLLTPRGWERRAAGRTWPVLWLLPGGDGDERIWTEQHLVQDIGELRDTLVVMPGMPLFGFYTDWWNGGAGGPPAVETFHLREVLPLLERDYGAGRARAVGGDSQGGFGALSYTARHPGLFRAAASYSGAVHPLAHPEVWLSGARYVGVDGTAIFGDPVAQRHVWEAHDPWYLADALRHTPVYLAAGDGTAGELDGPDPEPDPFIPGTEEWVERLPDDVISLTEAICGIETRALADRLIMRGTPVTAHFYPGTHGGTYGRRELRSSMPLLLRALDGGA